MPIAFPFFLFAKPAESALRWIRLDTGPPLADLKPDPRLIEVQRRLAERLPPHLRRDVLRDE
jgi:hypothetical protein